MFVAFKYTKTHRYRKLRIVYKEGTRGICPLKYFDCNKMKAIHLFLNKKEARDWLMRINGPHLGVEECFDAS